jgi:hypothetical protein
MNHRLWVHLKLFKVIIFSILNKRKLNEENVTGDHIINKCTF